MHSHKYNISTYYIVTIGLLVSILTLLKYLNNFIPNLYGFAIFELYYIGACIIVLVTSWKISLPTLLISPILWFLIGQTSIRGITGFFLDYMLPMLCPAFLIFVNVHKKYILNYLKLSLFIIIGGLLKLFFHTISGTINYHVPIITSIIMNTPAVIVTIYIAITTSLFILLRLNNSVKTQNIENILI